jgi:peptidoglycan-N-acetylglucosamine deacetylase
VPPSAPRPLAKLGVLAPKPLLSRGSHLPPRREARAIQKVLARTPYVALGGPHRREIALTFDDGPGPYTPRLLAVLRDLKVRATFFWVGRSLRAFPAAGLEEVRLGHAVGDHTEDHPFLGRLPEPLQRAEIEGEARQAHTLGLPGPRLFRPPYRSFSRATFLALARLHMLMVLWSVDTEDYRLPGARVIVQRVLAGARPGAIVLLHDAGGNRSQTVAAVPVIVRELRRRGYRLVTVPQLLADDPPSQKQAAPGEGGG